MIGLSSLQIRARCLAGLPIQVFACVKGLISFTLSLIGPGLKQLYNTHLDGLKN